MADRVRIYHRSGLGLADLRVTAERNWDIGAEAEAEFDLVTTDPNYRDDYLRWGNWLLIENDQLEPWVGMIDEPAEHRRFYVHVHAYTPERQLAYRDVPKQLRLSRKAGLIFQEMINITNRAQPTILQIGDVWTGGGDMPQENLSGDSLADYLVSLVERSGNEYSFTPATFNGQLRILCNWYQRIGVATNFPLEESYNLSQQDNALREQGRVYNELWGYGSGQSTADRPLASYSDPVSISLYGLRQGTKSYSDYTGSGAVANALRNEINQTKDPRRTFRLGALNVGMTWSNLRLGNTYPLRVWSLKKGIWTRVRIRGMHYDPFSGLVELNPEEVNDVAG